jgi:hypothetical protein
MNIVISPCACCCLLRGRTDGPILLFGRCSGKDEEGLAFREHLEGVGLLERLLPVRHGERREREDAVHRETLGDHLGPGAVKETRREEEEPVHLVVGFARAADQGAAAHEARGVALPILLRLQLLRKGGPERARQERKHARLHRGVRQRRFALAWPRGHRHVIDRDDVLLLQRRPVIIIIIIFCFIGKYFS